MTVTPPVTSPDPGSIRLGRRGDRFWRDLAAEGALAAAETVLAEEACRIADRLDKLDAILRGKGRAWLSLELAEDGVTVEVVVDKVLGEARQQATALKGIVGELRQSRGKAAQPEQGASRRDELAKRREERRRAAGL